MLKRNASKITYFPPEDKQFRPSTNTKQWKWTLNMVIGVARLLTLLREKFNEFIRYPVK